jgi:hypothetical protein
MLDEHPSPIIPQYRPLAGVHVAFTQVPRSTAAASCVEGGGGSVDASIPIGGAVSRAASAGPVLPPASTPGGGVFCGAGDDNRDEPADRGTGHEASSATARMTRRRPRRTSDATAVVFGRGRDSSRRRSR